MRLAVRHRVTLRYGRPMRMLVHSLRLDPSRFEGQRVGAWSILAEGGREGSGFRDSAGDMVRTLSVRGPASEVVLSVEGVVETTDLAGVLRGHREAVPAEAYARTTALTEASAETERMARATMAAAAGGTVLSLAHALSGAVADRLEADEAEGQDPAHLLIGAALVVGIPARYASGYLFGKVEGGASHGWAELWIDGLGWVGFDAANRCCPDDRYVRLCSGADAAEAAPIRGPGGLADDPGDEDVQVRQADQ